MNANPKNVHVLAHPLVQSFLTDIRDKDASGAIVRNRIRGLSVLLFYEATRGLPQSPVKVVTPLEFTVADSIGTPWLKKQ